MSPIVIQLLGQLVRTALSLPAEPRHQLQPHSPQSPPDIRATLATAPEPQVRAFFEEVSSRTESKSIAQLQILLARRFEIEEVCTGLEARRERVLQKLQFAKHARQDDLGKSLIRELRELDRDIEDNQRRLVAVTTEQAQSQHWLERTRFDLREQERRYEHFADSRAKVDAARLRREGMALLNESSAQLEGLTQQSKRLGAHQRAVVLAHGPHVDFELECLATEEDWRNFKY